MKINGKKIAQEKLHVLSEEIGKLSYTPQFCDVCVGESAVSAQYVRMKERTAESIGLSVVRKSFADDVDTDTLITAIEELNQMQYMRGLIVQLPLPVQVDTQAVLDTIAPVLDVDVLGEENTTRFYDGIPRYVYPTAKAIMHILDTVCEDLSRAQVVIVGHGKLVGRPVAHLLAERGVSVDVVTRASDDVETAVQTADVLISACGSPGLIDGAMVKEGVIAIDAGTAEVGGSVSGDIDVRTVAPKARYIAPVPGGVGPVTVASLLENVVLSAIRNAG